MATVRITQRDGRISELRVVGEANDVAKALQAEAKPILFGEDGRVLVVQMRNVAVVTVENDI
jgi:hypothetical protein